jgi:hypothetical protein
MNSSNRPDVRNEDELELFSLIKLLAQLVNLFFQIL